MDAALLLLRVALGSALIAHGRQTVSRWFGRGDVRPAAAVPLEAGGAAVGEAPADASRAGPMAGPAEIVAGVSVALGLLTPFGAAVGIGLAAVVCRRAHRHRGLSFGAEERFLLCAALVAAVLAFTGPGSLSVDGALGLHPRGLVWGVVALVFGLVGATAVLGGGDRMEDLEG